MEETGIYFIAFIITLLISYLLAEFFGRAKHIGFGWTFAISATTLFIGGIIALIASPSAKNKPTAGGLGFQIGAWVCLVFGILNLVMLNPLALGFFVLGTYLFKLSKGEIVNSNPKFYLKWDLDNPKRTSKDKATSSKKDKVSSKLEVDSQQRMKNLLNLKNKGLLTEEEYEDKRNEVAKTQRNFEILNSEEYEQLGDLLEEGILSKQEFEDKLELIKNIKKNQNSSLFEESNFDKKVFIGTWQMNDFKLKFQNKDCFEIVWNNCRTSKGDWLYDSFKHKLFLKLDTGTKMIRILEISQDKMKYFDGNSTFKSHKIK